MPDLQAGSATFELFAAGNEDPLEDEQGIVDVLGPPPTSAPVFLVPFVGRYSEAGDMGPAPQC
jgi:hypothetical protein